MKHRFLLPAFAATLFLSAFLIFAVQPMVGKFMLPLLGGSPSVWNTAMVFFQAALLAGYAYAHFIAKYLSLRLQGLLHLCLMAFFLLWLPLTLPDNSIPPGESGQAFWQLGIMFAAIGGPFFILAASAPLFQHWFSASAHKDAANPYFLYAVSNTGSMAALLLYPILIEPMLGLESQSYVWAGGYALLFLMTFLCAGLVEKGEKPVLPMSSNDRHGAPSWKTRAAWVFLALVPSSLMLGVTTVIATDLASAPFLWVIPLALYLLTFILAFARSNESVMHISRLLAGYAVCFAALGLMVTGFVMMTMPIVIIHLMTFFVCALFCHAELARLKPGLSSLTEYFLLISFGGVLGGVFNALIAPRIFVVPMEYPIALASICFILWVIKARMPPVHEAFNSTGDRFKVYKLFAIDVLMILGGIALLTYVFISKSPVVHAIGILGVFTTLILIVKNRPVFAFLALASLIMFEPTLSGYGRTFLTVERNYFGVLKVTSEGTVHSFYHGTTLHGAQWQDGASARVPTTYYSPDGPTGDIFKNLSRHKGPQNVAALGLGVGSIACFTAPERHFDFYEIDKDVADIATDRQYFTYLSECGSPYKIVIGDARRKMADAQDGSYDLIFVDTFSSDNIPVHIITREAMDIYKRKLAAGGIIAVNISNRYLDLKPVIEALAKDAGMVAYFKSHTPVKTKGKVSSLFAGSSFAVIASSPEDAASLLEDHGWRSYTGSKTARVWTDDYANIMSSLFFMR